MRRGRGWNPGLGDRVLAMKSSLGSMTGTYGVAWSCNSSSAGGITGEGEERSRDQPSLLL